MSQRQSQTTTPCATETATARWIRESQALLVEITAPTHRDEEAERRLPTYLHPSEALCRADYATYSESLVASDATPSSDPVPSPNPTLAPDSVASTKPLPQATVKTYKRRNTQVPADTPLALPTDDTRNCPYCPWVRTDDCAALWFRHVKSHLGEVIPPQWVCAGVPLERAGEFGLRPGEGDAYWFDGRKMVGGCLMGFSRRDSLRRHLYVTKGSGCVGDLKAPWIEGNKGMLKMGARRR